MYDVVIIGGGPAGGSAALFIGKAGKKAVVIDDGKSITKRAWIENHYGVEAIAGPDLVEIGKKQALKFGVTWVEGEAVGVEKQGDGWQVKTAAGETYAAKYVLLTTGINTKLAQEIGLEIVPGTEPRIQQIVKVDRQGRTNVEGIWAAGTVAGVSVHTIITAGDGANVAINIISEMNGARYVDHDVLKTN